MLEVSPWTGLSAGRLSSHKNNDSKTLPRTMDSSNLRNIPPPLIKLKKLERHLKISGKLPLLDSYLAFQFTTAYNIMNKLNETSLAQFFQP